MTIRTRPVELSDHEAITRLLIELDWFPRFRTDQLAERCKEVENSIRACLADDSHSLFVAEAESGFAGYASVHWLPYMFLAGREAYLSELFVVEAARGQGIGRALLETVSNEARRRGCSRLSLITSRHRESYLRNFYKNQGWVERESVANLVLEL